MWLRAGQVSGQVSGPARPNRESWTKTIYSSVDAVVGLQVAVLGANFSFLDGGRLYSTR